MAYFKNGKEIEIDNNVSNFGNHIAYMPSGMAIAYMDGDGQVFVNINGNVTQLHFNEFALTFFGNDIYVAGEDLTTRNIMLWKKRTAVSRICFLYLCKVDYIICHYQLNDFGC